MRNDLPDDSNRNNIIELLEKKLIAQTLKRSQEEYNNGDDIFKAFLKSIKCELGTDYVLLMDKVADKLPLSAQKLIFQS